MSELAWKQGPLSGAFPGCSQLQVKESFRFAPSFSLMTGNTEHDHESNTGSGTDSGTGQGGRHRLDGGVKRRRILIGGGAVAAVGGLAIAGIASADTTTTTTGSTTAADTVTATASSGVCTLTAEVTEGPYSLDGAPWSGRTSGRTRRVSRFSTPSPSSTRPTTARRWPTRS